MPGKIGPVATQVNQGAGQDHRVPPGHAYGHNHAPGQTAKSPVEQGEAARSPATTPATTPTTTPKDTPATQPAGDAATPAQRPEPLVGVELALVEEVLLVGDEPALVVEELELPWPMLLRMLSHLLFG